ncbi:3699_t:CDS:1, partial [Acaulospora colombiana]
MHHRISWLNISQTGGRNGDSMHIGQYEVTNSIFESFSNNGLDNFYPQGL